LEASNDGALCSFDSSIFKVRFCELIALDPVLLDALELLLLLFQLWLKSCHGTGISLPVVVEPEELLGVPVTLDRLEGTVSRPDVDVSVAPPAEESERMANSTRPDCGSMVRSLTCPRVFPSCDWTELFSSWLKRTLFPDCMELLLPSELELEPNALELDA